MPWRPPTRRGSATPRGPGAAECGPAARSAGPEGRATILGVNPSLIPPLLAALLAGAAGLPAQAPPIRGTLVIAGASEATSPVPTLWRGEQANQEVSDLLFLHLANTDPSYRLTDEQGWEPSLARSWKRRDSLTLAFELDPRARWEDGVPVTARDVVFALDRARDPRHGGATAGLLRQVASVTAESERVVVFRFRRRYSEQFYDAVFHAPPLPAHLLAALPPDSLGTSAFVQRPVGNGPYRVGERVAGQQLTLVANPRFFLGRPGIGRLIFLVAPSPEARVNLLLSGEADAMDNIYALPNPGRLETAAGFQLYPLPGLSINFASLNLRDPADTSRPHPVLADVAVRRALVLAANRQSMSRTAYGPFTHAPSGPLSALVGRAVDAPPPPPFDTAAARRTLTAAGWRDHDGDGVLDRDGRALAFRVMVPSISASRIRMATEMQESWRRLGIRAEIEQVDRPVYGARFAAGAFDVAMHGVNQDPTPSGLSQSWSCTGTGGSNVIHYCNPRVDSLLDRGQLSLRDAGRYYKEAIRLIVADQPAIFLAAPVAGIVVHRRFTQVRLRAESTWADAWRWRLRPELALERDGR